MYDQILSYLGRHPKKIDYLNMVHLTNLNTESKSGDNKWVYKSGNVASRKYSPKTNKGRKLIPPGVKNRSLLPMTSL